MNQDPNIKITYPRSDEYDYFVNMKIVNLDEECKKDLSNGHGFLISAPQSLSRALKSDDSIFSSKFGRTLQDENPYSHRFSCKYGCTQGAFFSVPDDANWLCPHCHTEVKLVGDDFTYFGWIVLKQPYKVISPIMYLELASLIGEDNLDNILEPSIELDADGNPISRYDKKIMKKKIKRNYKRKTPPDSTFEGLGMIGFQERFDEIINYFYKKKRKQKKEVYEMIIAHKDCVFTSSIPVFSSQLRIYKIEGKRFTFEKTNATYNLLAKLVAQINTDNLSIYKNNKLQNQLLYDIQTQLMNLSEEVINILKGKKGIMRSTITGRTSFSERTVIVPNSKLKMDEVRLPYTGLVIILEQIIVNILQSSYGITYAQAYKIWYYASLRFDQRVCDIIENLIALDKIHVLINRNPTISYGSIVWKKVVGVNKDALVMDLDPYILRQMNADFDGGATCSLLKR